MLQGATTGTCGDMRRKSMHVKHAPQHSASVECCGTANPAICYIRHSACQHGAVNGVQKKTAVMTHPQPIRNGEESLSFTFADLFVSAMAPHPY
jgi:hypothetical protein